MTTLSPVWGLWLSLALSGASGHATVSGTDANLGAMPNLMPPRMESAAMPPRPVLLAWDLRRFFGGSKKEPEKKEETPSPAPPTPPREPPPKPVPPPPPPAAPGLPPPALPPPKAAIPKAAPTLPAPATPAPQTRAPEKPTPKAPARAAPPALRPPPATAPVTVPPKGMTGEALARRVYDRDAGRDAVATVEMILTSRSGQTRVRRFDSQMRREHGLQDSLIRFTYPTDIQDTAFLTLERAGDDAEQFLYLPALRRVRRIVAKQKGKSFVNSDLYYQDLERRAPDKDQQRIVGEERVGDWQCWILESIPKEKESSAYGKTLAWIDQRTLVPVKGESFGRKQDKIKSTVVHRLDQVDGIWTVMDSEVTTLESQHTTRLTVQEIRYNTGLSPADFNKRALEK